MKCYKNIRLLITPTGDRARIGAQMNQVHTIHDAAIVVADGTIRAVGPQAEVLAQLPNEVEFINCRGLVALPGFVDSHTHAVFMGDRSNEFCMRASGHSYQEIAAMGGGIRASVDAVRHATTEEIADHSERFVRSALALGTTTMEIKSGYGLSTESELALLEAAKTLGERTPMQIVRTWLGAHAVPNGISQSAYVEALIHEQLPAVVAADAAEFVDVFCDEGYFTNEETERISRAASAKGLKIKLHVDELADTSGAELAARLGSFSADHLLKISANGIRALSASSDRTVATLLPITALCIRSPYAPARKMIEAGCAVAIATDCNPGSSMSENMQLAFSLAVIGMGMGPEEALCAATLNGAAAIDRARTHGSLEVGKAADFVLYDIPSLAYLPYHIGVSDVVSVIKAGSMIGTSV